MSTTPNPLKQSAEAPVVPFSKSKASVSLDAIRGLAALAVCSDHCRHMFLAEYHDVVSHHALLLIPYLATSAGHQAVIIFFVLSGYLISGSIFRSISQTQWSWKLYLTHRLVRLWLVLIPALVLGAIWDLLNIHFQRSFPHYGGAVFQNLTPGGISHSLTIPILFGNLFFTQKILVHTFGTNGPLWSLTNEFWYYILFPLGLFAFRSYYKSAMRALSAVAFLAGAWFVGKDILLMFPIWIGGAVLHFIPRPKMSTVIRVVSSILYCGAFLACVPLSRKYSLLADYILAIATAMLIWILLSAAKRSTDRFGERLARVTARFSYTLYLVHVPFLTFFASFLVHDSLMQPTVPVLLKAFLLWCMALLYAWLVASVTEFRMDSVRPWVERKVADVFSRNRAFASR